MSELPDGWAMPALDEIAGVRLGRQRSPKNHTGSRMRPYLRAANVTWSGLELSDVKKMNFTEAESETYELRPGDVLVAEASGSASEVGKPAIWRGEIEGCCFQNTLVRVRTQDASPEYLRYFLLLEARSGRIGDASPGVGIHHIGAGRLSEWPVPLPPLNEQRRIVAAIEEHLSRLDAADASLGGASRRLNVLRDSVSRAVHGEFPTVPLAEIAVVASGQTPKGLETSSVGPIPYYKVGDMNAADGRRMGRARAYVTEAGAAAAKLRIYPAGTVVFPKRGGAIATNKKRVLTVPAAVDLNTMAVVPGDQLLPEFLLAYFETVDLGSLADGSNVPQINHGDIRPLDVPFAPLEEQRRIVAEIEERLGAIAALRAAIERAQRRGAALRRSVLERAFRGELVPQDPSDEPASVLLDRIRAERSASK